MEQTKLTSLATRLGYITGPIIILMGVLLHIKGVGMGKFFIGFGAFRTLLSMFIMYKKGQIKQHPSSNNNSQEQDTIEN
jgi:tellurite resistance protein TehA-like permease